MINRNLGTLERTLRLVGAVVLAGWVLSRDSHGPLSALAGIAALALFANAIFSRCYLWALLGISSCDPDDEHGGAPPQGS
ncbi:MAG: YgaP family membrane protein [Pseudohaliea sp.]